MKIALIGYGAMGKLIKTLAENKNHEIAVIIDETDAHLSVEKLADKLKGVDAAIFWASFINATFLSKTAKNFWY